MAERVAGSGQAALSLVSLLRARRVLRWAALHVEALATWAAAIACIGAAFVVYWPRLHDFFVYDDFFFLQAVRSHSLPIVLQRAFTFPTGELLDPVTPFWRPLIDVYFYALRLVGLHSEPYHAVNFLLHGVVGALAVLFFRRLTGSVFAAAAIGLLFVVAPTYDFAVSWVAQVSELLAAALVLGALLTYYAYLTAERHNRAYVAATLLITVLAFLTKESTVILAVLLPGLAVSILDGRRRRSWREVTYSVAAPLALGTVFLVAMETHDALSDESLPSLGWHMPRNLWDYLTWMVFPYRYGEAAVLRGAVATLFFVAGALAIVLRRRALGLTFVWTLVALVPFTAFDEWIELRYTYLATLPFVAFVVLLVRELIEALPRPLARAAWGLAAVVLVCALLVTPFRTREQQVFLVREADRIQAAVSSVRSLCGRMPQGSFVYLIDAPYRDLGLIHTPAALNLYYDRVNAASVPELPPLAAFIEDKCVLQYDSQTRGYVRTE